jgi:hypothetical protein
LSERTRAAIADYLSEAHHGEWLAKGTLTPQIDVARNENGDAVRSDDVAVA